MPAPTNAVIAIQDPTTNAVLLTKRAATLRLHPSEYCFPGGRIETGETPLDAALRELYEETHLHPQEIILDPFREDTSAAVDALPHSVTTYTTNKTFTVIYAHAHDAASLLSMLALNPDEVESAKWFDPAQCVIEPETTDRGVIRVTDPTDNTVIEGATADVVTALFAVSNK